MQSANRLTDDLYVRINGLSSSNRPCFVLKTKGFVSSGEGRPL